MSLGAIVGLGLPEGLIEGSFVGREVGSREGFGDGFCDKDGNMLGLSLASVRQTWHARGQ